MPTTIPPLSQSRQALLACPLSYVEQVIHGRKQIPSDAARRGTALHRFLSDYVTWLVKNKKRKDTDRAAELMIGMKADAAKLLGDLVDDFEIDPEKVWATEQHVTLDDQFVWLSVGAETVLKRDSAAPPAYEATIDLVELADSQTAKVVDYKSQFHVFDPAESFQARLYSLIVMLLNPQIEQVEFELRFVRWGSKARSVKFTRANIEGLKAEAQRWRSVQLGLHSAYGHNGAALPEAIAGDHCVYCPLLRKGCPLEDANPAADPESALRRAMYHRLAAKLHEETLRAHCEVHGPLRVTDGIGNAYEAGWTVGEQKKYSLDSLPTLQDWEKKREKDFLSKLSISGLGNLMKAKKRGALAEEMANFCSVTAKSKFRIGKASGLSEDEGADEEEAT